MHIYPAVVEAQVTNDDHKSHPWYARIHYCYNKNEDDATMCVNECGAAIVTSRTLLTTATCVFAPDYFVIVGGHPKYGEAGLSTTLEVKKTIVHPTWDAPLRRYGRIFNHNIAIVVTLESIMFTPTIRPIPLMATNEYPTVKESAIVYGLVYGGTMNQIVWEPTSCLSYYGPGWSPDLLCVGTPNPSVYQTCPEDFGGPLVQENHGKFVMAGILVSGSMVCEWVGRPSVYNRVSAYYDWIVQEHSLIEMSKPIEWIS